MRARRSRDDVTLLIDDRASPLQFALQLRDQIACFAELARKDLALGLAARGFRFDNLFTNEESIRIANLDARRSWRRSHVLYGISWWVFPVGFFVNYRGLIDFDSTSTGFDSRRLHLFSRCSVTPVNTGVNS